MDRSHPPKGSLSHTEIGLRATYFLEGKGNVIAPATLAPLRHREDEDYQAFLAGYEADSPIPNEMAAH
ncbi:unnamed protein product [Euphydryas editha]|uniref:Uncharacterized protein n=1 Tax=Euphydryas editha TaxID=104508 RepID=A0AAU9TY88_EUPED|nr:unnamed protein product [Euphydryas editha]